MLRKDYWNHRYKTDPAFRKNKKRYAKKYAKQNVQARRMYLRRWRKSDKGQKYLERKRNMIWNTWCEMIKLYGNECSCCGQKNLLFLTIDHVNGGGRKDFRVNGWCMYKRIIDENDKSKYRVLCYNCNCGRRRNGGICPHCGIRNDSTKNDTPIERKRYYHRNYKKNIWVKMIETYGARCHCCSETVINFLTIDHINGGGSKDGSNPKIWKRITKENDPSKYRVLCFNCNCGRARNNGMCPHVSEGSDQYGKKIQEAIQENR